MIRDVSPAGAVEISEEMLRDFAKGRLDESIEFAVIALLDTRPDLAARIAAISTDSVIKKLGADCAPCETGVSSHGSSRAIPPGEVSDGFADSLAELPDYKILSEIGRGGMGVVYLAEHRLTGRKEVLKVLNERLMTNVAARKRFDQEIQCIASMNHDTIVRCYTVQQLKHTLVLCMEYVPGTNLHQFINANGPLSVPVACEIAIEICRALQHGMDNNLVHRDIKPSNIMLGDVDGKIRVKILDFGLARLTTRDRGEGLTDNGTLLGTLEYIAPEQCLNAAAADIRSDIYSLGCTLYHMLVGHPPFSGSTGELVLAHAQLIPPAINLLRPEIPGELAGVLSKMLAKQPDRRFAAPKIVANELMPFRKKKKTSKMTESVPCETQQQRSSVDVQTETSEEIAVAQCPTVVSIATKPPNHFASESGVAIRTQSLLERIRQSRKYLSLLFGTAVLFAVVIIKTKAGIIRVSGLPDDAEVTFEKSSTATTGDPKETESSSSTGRDWKTLFDGSRSSFYENWTIHDLSPKSTIDFETEGELNIVSGPGENDFVGFRTFNRFDPSFHVSLRFKNYNGSPKVMAIAKHRAPKLVGIVHSVTLGGLRDSQPHAKIIAVGSMMSASVHEKGSDFTHRAKPIDLKTGQPCHMELICYSGRFVVKVDGVVVNDYRLFNTRFEKQPLHFWTKRSARIAFTEIKFRQLDDQAEFDEAITIREVE
jgi:serine/threonine protein kinase